MGEEGPKGRWVGGRWADGEVGEEGKVSRSREGKWGGKTCVFSYERSDGRVAEGKGEGKGGVRSAQYFPSRSCPPPFLPSFLTLLKAITSASF